jgi:endonuclease YncB( thermonuclease family)
LGVRGSRYRIELFGIDAPELNQPWGRTATDRLYSLLTGRFVVITGANPGEDGVVAGSLTFRDRDVALDLIHDGLAWSTILPANDGATLHPYPAAEFQARIARRGLWSDETPIPPWEWRRQHPGNTD